MTITGILAILCIFGIPAAFLYGWSCGFDRETAERMPLEYGIAAATKALYESEKISEATCRAYLEYCGEDPNEFFAELQGKTN